MTAFHPLLYSEITPLSDRDSLSATYISLLLGDTETARERLNHAICLETRNRRETESLKDKYGKLRTEEAIEKWKADVGERVDELNSSIQNLVLILNNLGQVQKIVKDSLPHINQERQEIYGRVPIEVD